MKAENIFSNNGMLFVAICIVLAGLLVYSISSAVSSPVSVVEETVIDNSSNQMEWWPEETTTITDSISITHRVKSGDCVYNLAQKYRTTVKQIVSWNRLTNPSLINVGQELIVGYDIKSRIIKSEVDIKAPNYEPKRQADVEQLSLSLSLYYTSKRDEFPFYISEYVKSNSNENNHDNNRDANKLATRNTFTESKNLSFFEKLDVLGIKYNTTDNPEYGLYDIALSMAGNFRYKFGGKMTFDKEGRLKADCSHFNQALMSAWLGKVVPYRTTSMLFANANKINLEKLTPGMKVGWTAFKRDGKKINGHVYIYVGDGQFVNMSGKRKGVFFTDLKKIQDLSKIYDMKMTG